MRLYGTLTKIDAAQRTVAGYASTEAVDAHGETILKSAIEAALDGYLEFPTVRQMHQLDAVGKTIEATVDDRGLYIAAKVVDDIAWEKVTTGVYKGFSIGGKVLARDSKDKTIITKIQLNEISLVDRPSNPEARFDVWKAAGAEPAIDTVTKATIALDAIDRAVRPNSSDVIMKAFAAKDAEIERLQKRVDELLAEPAPPKTAGAYGFRAVSKEDDAGGACFQKRQANEDDLIVALGAMSEEDRAMLLIKAAQQLPRPVTMVQAQ
jgi:HK97 family phage prohead protease